MSSAKKISINTDDANAFIEKSKNASRALSDIQTKVKSLNNEHESDFYESMVLDVIDNLPSDLDKLIGIIDSISKLTLSIKEEMESIEKEVGRATRETVGNIS